MPKKDQSNNVNHVTEATQKDWDDFWNNSEYDRKQFEDIWNEMEKIEPLTPKINET